MIMKPILASLITCLVLVLVFAVIGCGTSATAVPSATSVPTTQAAPVPPALPSVNNPVQPSATAPATPAAMDIKTEAIYFHLTARCVTCLCFEKQINYVMSTFYETEKNNGKLVYKVLNAQEKQNADIVKKYKAIGSQFFVNTIINGIDHIKDIESIWDWNCTKDANGFNQKIRIIIDRSLKGEF
jgi:hypothetical protein